MTQQSDTVVGGTRGVHPYESGSTIMSGAVSYPRPHASCWCLECVEPSLVPRSSRGCPQARLRGSMCISNRPISYHSLPGASARICAKLLPANDSFPVATRLDPRSAMATRSDLILFSRVLSWRRSRLRRCGRDERSPNRGVLESQASDRRRRFFSACFSLRTGRRQ